MGTLGAINPAKIIQALKYRVEKTGKTFNLTHVLEEGSEPLLPRPLSLHHLPAAQCRHKVSGKTNNAGGMNTRLEMADHTVRTSTG